jgi:putative transposase
MDDSEHDVLAYMTFPAPRRTKLHSTNPLERLNKEVKRRADVVGIFPNEASITRLIGAVLFEQNDEWLLQCRYMQIEGMGAYRGESGFRTFSHREGVFQPSRFNFMWMPRPLFTRCRIV